MWKGHKQDDDSIPNSAAALELSSGTYAAEQPPPILTAKQNMPKYWA